MFYSFIRVITICDYTPLIPLRTELKCLSNRVVKLGGLPLQVASIINAHISRRLSATESLHVI